MYLYPALYLFKEGSIINKYERRSIRSYQKKADRYDDTLDGRFTYKFKEYLLRTIVIPDGGRVLDVACGNGRLLQMMSEKHDFAGYGIDISEKMVENASRLNPSMIFVRAGCDALPFEDEFFDVVTVCAAFHHFPDVSGFAKEVFRVLKANGMLYVAEVYCSPLLRAIYNPFIKFSWDGDVKFYAPDEIREYFENVGFKQEMFEKEGHIQVVAVRKK